MATLEWDVEAAPAAARQGATARIEEREKMVYCSNRRGREKGQVKWSTLSSLLFNVRIKQELK